MMLVTLDVNNVAEWHMKMKMDDSMRCDDVSLGIVLSKLRLKHRNKFHHEILISEVFKNTFILLKIEKHGRPILFPYEQKMKSRERRCSHIFLTIQT